jgi:hypothetical protein
MEEVRSLPLFDEAYPNMSAENDRLRLPMTFDAGRLQSDLSRCRDADWVEHFVKDNYEGRWHVLPLRAPAGAEHPVMMIYSDPTCETFVDTPLLDRCPYIRALLGQFDCRLEAVRLMRLGPDSVIREHRDLDLSLEDGSDFRLNGEPVAMRAGECWYLRLSDPHSVTNRSGRDRVHLVIDARVNDWLRELLERAAATSS